MKSKLTKGIAAIALACSVALPASAEIGKHSFKVSNGASEDHPISAGVNGMSACLEAGSEGKMKLKGFYNGQLGDDAEATQSTRSGSIEMVVTGAAASAGSNRR